MSQGNFDLIIVFIIKLLFIASIFFDAKGDAVIDETKKRDHTLEVLDKATWMLILFTVWYYFNAITLISIFTYIPLRMGLFNVLYNKNRDLPYHYVGETDKWYDKWILWMSKIEKQPKKYKFPILTIWYFVIFFIGFFLH